MAVGEVLAFIADSVETGDEAPSPTPPGGPGAAQVQPDEEVQTRIRKARSVGSSDGIDWNPPANCREHETQPHQHGPAYAHAGPGRGSPGRFQE